MKTRMLMTLMLYPMVNAVLFGAGAVLVLSLDILKPVWEYALPVAIVAALVAAIPISWIMAPRLRLRFWDGRRQQALSR